VPRKSRTRLAPDVRRDQLLDEAGKLVLGSGLNAVTMDELADAARVSKALVYTYFRNRTEVLGALLLREVKHFQHEGRSAVAGAATFEEMIRGTTSAYLDHVSKRGVLIQRLMGDPTVATSISELDLRERGITITYLSKEVARRYGLSRRRARLVTEMLMGVTGRAADMQHRGAAKRGELQELVFSILFASLQALADQEIARSRSKSVRSRAAARTAK